MFRKFVVALALARLLALPLSAQMVSGALRGTALDAQGAAIPDVQVTMTNLETGIAASTTTDGEGRYRIAAVKPGIYSLEYKREGFETVRVERVVIVTAQESSVDAPLKVGTTSTHITVEVPGLELDKVGPNVRFNLYWQILDETPMSTSSLVPATSRNFLRYVLMGPAVARVPGQNETSTAGHRGRENNYLTDGVENNDNTVTLPAIFIPPEAIREFQVQIATYTAEFGHSMGSNINVTTKSGSNAFHGDFWDFSRSSALEPLSFQAQKALLKKTPRLSAHQFGADFGGPIVQNKTFFFGIVQWNLQRQAALTLSSVTIPTPDGYQALLGAPLRPAAAVPEQSVASRQEILNKLSFLPDFYNELSGFSSYSSTTVNSTLVPLGSFVPLIPQNQDIWYVGGRLDHQFANDTLSYRLHMDHRNKPLGASLSNRAFGERWAADDLTFGQTHALSYTKVVNSHWVNEARFAYTRLDPSLPERDPVSPTIKITNPGFTIGGTENFPQNRLEQTYQFQNVSSFVRNRHTLKVGVDLARTRMENDSAPNSKGTWVFASLESFMNSAPQSLTQLVVAQSRYSFAQLRQAYFFQDDMKVTRNFMINLGLRYELQSVPLGFFGATSQEVLDTLVPGPVKRDNNNFAPRFGFAYSPQFESGVFGKLFGAGQSSIRGGFGMGYDVLFYNLLTNPATNYPRNSPNQQTTSQLIDVFPTQLPPQTTPPVLNPMLLFANLPSDTQRPTSNYWSLSVQRQLNPNLILELGYIGNRSYHLLRQSQANPGVLDPAKAAFVRATCTYATLSSCQEPAGFPISPLGPVTATDSGRQDPRFGSRVLLEATGQAEYHAGYIRLEKKFSSGLQFGVNYTWSANLSDSDDLLISDTLLTGSSPLNPQDYRDRHNEWARSVLDRPHRFSAQYAYRIPGFTVSSNAFLRHALSGWQVSGFTELQSGQPFTIRVGTDVIGNGLSNASAAGRPNYNPNGILIQDADTGNLRTFRIPLDGTGIVDAPHVTNPANGAVTYLRNSMEFGGNLGRNTFRGPGLANTNLSVMKRFTLPKEMQLQVRGDFINAFNHHNFANPDSTMNNASTFGLQTLAPVIDSRQVQLGAKLSF